MKLNINKTELFNGMTYSFMNGWGTASSPLTKTVRFYCTQDDFIVVVNDIQSAFKTYSSAIKFLKLAVADFEPTPTPKPTPKPKMILSTSADAKTIKGQVHGYLTGILYLAPSDISGVNLCPFAKLAGCEIACLYTAGRGAFSNVQLARINKANLFNKDREAFMASLVYSINKVIKGAIKQGLIPVIRLNGTSDIQFEKIGLTVEGIDYKNIFEVFPTIQFYDYTKIPTRNNIPSNYDLTFSYSGVESFQSVWNKALKNDELKRFAVVFSNRDKIPAQFAGMTVIDGDSTDLRFLDKLNTVVGLYAKGKAKQDKTGFVVQV
jgi:hypothetical protein